MKLDADIMRHLPLAPHVFQILLSLLKEDLHGYALLKDIAERTEGEVTLGTSTLYSAVQRMVREGFLEEDSRVGDKGKVSSVLGACAQVLLISQLVMQRAQSGYHTY